MATKSVSIRIEEEMLEKLGFVAKQLEKGIQGDYNNVVGLPIGRLYQEVKSWITEA